MMYRCYVCRILLGSGSSLIQHLKLLHGLYPGKKLNLICAQDNCSLEFRSYSGFRRHLKRLHSDTDAEPSCSDGSRTNSTSPFGMPALPLDRCCDFPSVETLNFTQDMSETGHPSKYN